MMMKMTMTMMLSRPTSSGTRHSYRHHHQVTNHCLCFLMLLLLGGCWSDATRSAGDIYGHGIAIGNNKNNKEQQQLVDDTMRVADVVATMAHTTDTLFAAEEPHNNEVTTDLLPMDETPLFGAIPSSGLVRDVTEDLLVQCNCVEFGPSSATTATRLSSPSSSSSSSCKSKFLQQMQNQNVQFDMTERRAVEKEYERACVSRGVCASSSSGGTTTTTISKREKLLEICGGCPVWRLWCHGGWCTSCFDHHIDLMVDFHIINQEEKKDLQLSLEQTCGLA